MRALFLSLLLMVAAPLAAQADDRHARIHAALEFIDNSGMWEATLLSVGDLGALVAAEFDGLAPDQSRDIRDLVNTAFEEQHEGLRVVMARVHADHLPVADLERLNAMFLSPMGRQIAARVARGQAITAADEEAIMASLSPEDEALSQALFNSPAADRWNAIQPDLQADIEQESMIFSQRLIEGLLPEIRAILYR